MLPLIVYPWLVVSVIIYGRRLYRRSRTTGDTTSSPFPPPTVPGPAAPTAPPAPKARVPATPVPHVSRQDPAPVVPASEGLPVAPPTFAADGTPVMDATHFPLEPAVAAALAEEGRLASGDAPADDAADAPVGRSGLFAKGDEAPAPVPLATLIAGIVLPCDLAPLSNVADAEPTATRAWFVTSDHEPAVVGSELGDELERLGFTLSSSAANQVVATGPAGRLTATLHLEPHRAGPDGSRRFPTTRDGDVVVELAAG